MPDADRSPGRLPDQVRRDCAAVAARAGQVAIDPEALVGLARRLAQEWSAPARGPEPPPGDLRPTASPWSMPAPTDDTSLERVVATAVILDTVNFGSGWHPVLRKDPGASGATTVARAVRDWLDAGETHADRFGALDADDLSAICRQPPAAMELMAHFAAALTELASLLHGHGRGRVLPLVTAAGGSAAAFAEALATLPAYRDVARHGGESVALYKRAQLAAADVARAGAGDPRTTFRDLDRLTAFADNLVPHVLRIEGVLRVDDDLVGRIDRGELLEPGSPGEVELRAVGVHAVELLAAELAARGHPLPPHELDARLWERGGAPRFKAVPRHRARTTAY